MPAVREIRPVEIGDAHVWLLAGQFRVVLERLNLVRKAVPSKTVRRYPRAAAPFGDDYTAASLMVPLPPT